MSNDKITIKLTPHNAICILSFLCEFFTDENKDVPEFAAMHEALHEYETQIVNYPPTAEPMGWASGVNTLTNVNSSS